MAKKPELNLEFFQKKGRIGGKLGGPMSWKKMTPEQRSERARLAVAARKWHPVKPPAEETESPAPEGEIPKTAARVRQALGRKKKKT